MCVVEDQKKKERKEAKEKKSELVKDRMRVQKKEGEEEEDWWMNPVFLEGKCYQCSPFTPEYVASMYTTTRHGKEWTCAQCGRVIVPAP
eukprot:g28651.t1